MKRVGTVMGLLFVGGCGLFDLGDGDSDSNSGGSNSNSQSDSRGSNSGDADVTSLGGPTDGHGPGGDDWWTEDSGYTEPPTTGIEMTGADNMLPDDEMCPCVADNDDIYVLSDAGTIWSFDPPTAQFTFITDIVCGGMTDTFSMGVSRKGRAWVEYFNGDLYTVDLKDPGSACKDPGVQERRPAVPDFGMAFVGNSAPTRATSCTPTRASPPTSSATTSARSA
jgi:hypothetical protein